MTLFDRSGSFFGRTSEQGILQRFSPTMDNEYPLDLISFSPTLMEEYEWYRHEQGARFRAGSINHLQLVTEAEVKATVPIGGTWRIDARLDHEESLTADRNLVWLQLRHGLLDERLQAFGNMTLKSHKPDIDIELGGTWQMGATRVTVGVAALDLFNNFVYGDLGIAAGIADTILDYTSQPFTARLTVESSLTNRVRLEGYALAMTPTEVVAESQRMPGVGFRQEERYAYTGALLEWRPGDRTAVGAFGTWVRARLGRTPLAAGTTEDDFDLTEKTVRLGVYAIRSFHPRLLAEGWLARAIRNQDRVRDPATGLASVDYEDRAWEGRFDLTYRAPMGFRGALGLEFVARDVIGTDDVPGQRLERDHSRLRLDVAWQFGKTAFLLFGTNVDIDQDGGAATGWFDGGHGRLTLYW